MSSPSPLVLAPFMSTKKRKRFKQDYCVSVRKKIEDVPFGHVSATDDIFNLNQGIDINVIHVLLTMEAHSRSNVDLKRLLRL